ncbi:hypothetical protein WA026_022362 [Henosepilachna vigintioctopunctata]|uniref:Uncharacterized protein n=1 Tax=Henosepilachna vigintioctopunctata TaxID=420089 RepID=A0AAW1UVG5_9CUCU
MESISDLIRELYVNNRNEDTLNLYKQYKNQYLQKSQMYRRICNENKIAIAVNIKKSWKIIHTETGRENRRTLMGAPSANNFNEFFTNMGINITEQITDALVTTDDFMRRVAVSHANSLFFRPVTEKEVSIK